MRHWGTATRVVLAGLVCAVAVTIATPDLKPAKADVTSEQVERAIRSGVNFLKQRQQNDGRWPNRNGSESRVGVTCLAMLALLNAGETPDDPQIRTGLRFVRQFPPNELNFTYDIALQTMVYALADPETDLVRITENVRWLEATQLTAQDNVGWPGSWSYTASKSRPGDGSNSQYALLGLNAAQEVGVEVDPVVWERARNYWQLAQRNNGSWPYRPGINQGTASMTCAGISSLAITSSKRSVGENALVGGQIVNCGARRRRFDRHLLEGMDWMANNFSVSRNRGTQGRLWLYYYLYGLERAGRLSGIRFFGSHDWYREGAEFLVNTQDKFRGFWRGTTSYENDETIATSFALLFLAKGRAPVLIHKLVHGPDQDWTPRRDDIRNLTAVVSRDWETLLTWQVADPSILDVEELLLAPIGFMNGNRAPTLTPRARQNLRTYLEQGGFLLAEATDGSDEFDRGFRQLVDELFPDEDYQIRPLPEGHAVWRSRYKLTSEIHPLYGVDIGCRTAIIYTDEDLSCYWNLAESYPGQPEVEKALRVGQNIVDYATGREVPGTKLEPRTVNEINVNEIPKRGVLRIAKLHHGGDWDIAPLAIPNLMTALRDNLGFDVAINHREIFASDPNMAFYPLVYMHGRTAVSFSDGDIDDIRTHLTESVGTLFADAACGSQPFDTAFRNFAAQLFPDYPLEPIPPDDLLYSEEDLGYDLSQVEYSRALGGGAGPPQLEGVKIDGRWVIIYSKYDLGCALEKQAGLDCKGYKYESALKVCTNIVLYATAPF